MNHTYNSRTKIISDARCFARNTGKCDESGNDLLGLLTYAFLKKLADDSREIQSIDNDPDHQAICCVHAFKALSEMHLVFLSIQLESVHQQYLKKKKSSTIKYIKNAGFGSTSDHVQFIRNVLRNEHKTIDSELPKNRSVDNSDSETY